MISISTDYCPARIAPTPGARSIIAQPNRSADWQTNKQLFLACGIVSGLVATTFGLIGAWLVLPFAGIEITALGGALYIVCRKLNQRHILHFSGEQLIIEKGSHHPQQVWQLPKQHTFISIERRSHPWDPIRLTLCCYHSGNHATISVGEFLNREDSQQLLATLREQGLRVRNDSVIAALTL